MSSQTGCAALICSNLRPCGSNLSVELEPANPQVHPREALVCSDGVDLDELVLADGGAHGSVRLIVVQVEGFLREQVAAVITAL